jgi:hypothetical protein
LFIANIGAAVSSGHAVTSWGLDKAAFNAFHKNSHKISGSFLTCLGMMLFDLVFYAILTWYFDKVLPKEFGSKLHPLFFLNPFLES